MKKQMPNTPPMKTDGQAYSVDLNLHHPSRDPAEITKELARTPWFARKQGDITATIQHKSTAWLCHFQRGAGNVAFDQTLQDVVSFIAEQESFLLRFSDEGGTTEIVLNAYVPFDDGKIFELSLDPFFLKQLSQVHLQLRIQIWSKNEGDRIETSSEACQ